MTQSQIIYQEQLATELTGVIIDIESGRVVSLVVSSTSEVKLSLDLDVLVASLPVLQRLASIGTQVPLTVFTPEPTAEDRGAEAARLHAEEKAAANISSLPPQEHSEGIDPRPGADGWG